MIRYEALQSRSECSKKAPLPLWMKPDDSIAFHFPWGNAKIKGQGVFYISCWQQRPSPGL